MTDANLPLWILWNLGLAYFPVGLAFVAARGMRQKSTASWVHRLLCLPLLLLWLLFLPNTCYLLTEWRHYLDVVNANPAYVLVYRYGRYPPDTTLTLLLLTALFSVYTGLGLLALFLAVYPLSRLAAEHWSRGRLLAAQGAMFVLCSVGTYLGLVNRFNSWDVLRQNMAPAVLRTVSALPARPVLLVLLLVFAAVLWLLYTLFDIWVDGARLRFLRPK